VVTTRRALLVAAVGVVAVVVGVVVLRSPGADVSIGWFSYGGPPTRDLLDSLVAWNRTREVGAGLVLVGLLVIAALLGVLAASRGRAVPARLAGAVLVLAAVLVLGGAVAFVMLDVADPITRQLGTDSSVWTRDQSSAALVVASGLVLGAVGAGLRRSNVP
jgi:hypothetical protein